MPHPLALLENPLPRERFKKLAKSLVINYWEVKLRGEAALLPSLKYFKPEFHSLSTPIRYCGPQDLTPMKCPKLWCS